MSVHETNLGGKLPDYHPQPWWKPLARYGYKAGIVAWIVGCIAILLLATGCAGQDSDRVTISNPSGVTIVREGTVETASARASSECAKYGKHAKLTHSQGFIMSFDCVSR